MGYQNVTWPAHFTTGRLNLVQLTVHIPWISTGSLNKLSSRCWWRARCAIPRRGGACSERPRRAPSVNFETIASAQAARRTSGRCWLVTRHTPGWAPQRALSARLGALHRLGVAHIGILWHHRWLAREHSLAWWYCDQIYSDTRTPGRNLESDLMHTLDSPIHQLKFRFTRVRKWGASPAASAAASADASRNLNLHLLRAWSNFPMSPKPAPPISSTLRESSHRRETMTGPMFLSVSVITAVSSSGPRAGSASAAAYRFCTSLEAGSTCGVVNDAAAAAAMARRPPRCWSLGLRSTAYTVATTLGRPPGACAFGLRINFVPPIERAFISVSGTSSRLMSINHSRGGCSRGRLTPTRWRGDA
eukprot:SAG11_NODE_484_length_9060_cov_7.118514_5_plen_361_part_00